MSEAEIVPTSAELLAFLTFGLLATLLVGSLRLGRPYFFVFAASLIVASNVTVSKTVMLLGLPTSLAVIAYSLLYLAINICAEYATRGEAYRLALTTVAVQVGFSMYVQASIATPGATPDQPSQTAIATLFGTTPRVTAAAVLASIGLFVDISIYDRLSRRWPATALVAQIKNVVSAAVGQAANSVVFFSIAFFGEETDLVSIVAAAIIVKSVLAAVTAPFLFLARYALPEEWQLERSHLLPMMERGGPADFEKDGLGSG